MPMKHSLYMLNLSFSHISLKQHVLHRFQCPHLNKHIQEKYNWHGVPCFVSYWFWAIQLWHTKQRVTELLPYDLQTLDLVLSQV